MLMKLTWLMLGHHSGRDTVLLWYTIRSFKRNSSKYNIHINLGVKTSWNFHFKFDLVCDRYDPGFPDGWWDSRQWERLIFPCISFTLHYARTLDGKRKKKHDIQQHSSSFFKTKIDIIKAAYCSEALRKLKLV